MLSYERVRLAVDGTPVHILRQCRPQEERAQGAELRRLAQQELTNTGRVASEGEIKLWLKARADRDRDKAAGFDKPTSQA